MNPKGFILLSIAKRVFMFLLNTIAGTSSSGPDDAFSLLFQTESKIESLETLLRSFYLREQFDYNPETAELDPYPELNNSDVDAIKQALTEAREEEQNLLSILGDTLERDPSVRYQEVQSEELEIGQKIAEVQSTLDTLNANTEIDNQNDIQFYMDELNRLTAYKSELNVSDDFWSQLMAEHLDFEVSMQKKDQFFNGGPGETSGGYNTLMQYEGLLGFLESGKNGNEYDINPEMDGIQKPQGLLDLNNKSEIREKILVLQKQLINQIPEIKDESWFQTFLEDNESTLAENAAEIIATQRKVNSLNYAFTKMAAGEQSEVTIAGVTYVGIDQVKNQILNSNSYLQDLNLSQEFLNQVKVIASSDDPSSLTAGVTEKLTDEYNNLSKVDSAMSAMYKTLELQGLLTNLTVRKGASYSVEGVSYDVVSVTAALMESKENQKALMDAAGISPESVSLVNLMFTNKMEQMVNDRIANLQVTEKFLDDLSKSFYQRLMSLGYDVPYSFYYQDPNLTVIRAELKDVQTYKGVMDQDQAYWSALLEEQRRHEAEVASTSTPTVLLKPLAAKCSTSSTSKPSGTLNEVITRNETGIDDLTGTSDFMSGRESIDSLKDRQKSVKEELEYEISNLKNLNPRSTTFLADKDRIMGRIAELEMSVNSILQEISRTSMMDNVASSLEESLSRQSLYQKMYIGEF